MNVVFIGVSLALAAMAAVTTARLPARFGHCNVVPLSENDTIRGGIFLKQTMRGPLEIHLQLTGFNHEDGHSHELHVHEYGDLSGGCASLGGHFNPTGSQHAAHGTDQRHVGDLGVIECDEEGNSNSVIHDGMAMLYGSYNIIGHSLAIHATASEDKLACCVIGKSTEETWSVMHGTMHAMAGEGDSKGEGDHTGHGGHHGHHGHLHGRRGRGRLTAMAVAAHDGHDHGEHEGHRHELHSPEGHDHANHEGHDHSHRGRARARAHRMREDRMGDP